MSGKKKYSQWFDGHKINEILFCGTFRNILVLIDPNKPGALDNAFFEEHQNQAPYTPFLP